MHQMKILLLNPPGEKLYIRDYYCSKVSKSNYLFQPIDLTILSGRLTERFEVKLIDAIADSLTPVDCLGAVESFSPDVVISLIGSVCLEEDIRCLESLKKDGRKILISGDAVLENPAGALKQYPFIDAVVLDFTSADPIAFIDGDFGRITSMVYRVGRKVVDTGYKRPGNEEYTLPIPTHELFTSKNYRFPFVKHKDFATVLTDYGCPFKCTFCVMSTLGYRYRTTANVLDEFASLQRLGKKELFIFDQTFGIYKKRALELCRGMESAGFGFGWVCYSRVDVVDGELLSAMKGAGCHTIMFGVESASEEILKKYHKGYTKAQIRDAFRHCKASGIRTVGTFILGFPDDTEDTINETIEFLKEIDCDFASFNVAVPRMNTGLRQEAIREGLIDSDLEVMDQTGSSIAMPTKYLTREQVQELKKRAVRQFYLRPSYLWKRLKSVSSFYELKEQVMEGWALLWKAGRL